MAQHGRFPWIPTVLSRKPLQAAKFVGVLLSLVLGVAGFLRLLDPSALASGSPLLDGQFLALLLVPLVSLGLVAVVFVETLVSAYRVVRSDRSVGEQLAGRVGYVALRGVEAGIALLGVGLFVTVLPVLVAESTPAPAGVGAMLLLMAVGLGILVASLVRSAAELFVFSAAS